MYFKLLIKIFLSSYFLFFLSCANKHNLSEKKQPFVKARYIFMDKSTDLYGLLDENGKELIAAKYKDIKWIQNGLFRASEKEGVVLIKANGNLINKKFQEIGDFKLVNQDDVDSERLAVAALYETKKYGFINLSGDFAINPIFDKVRNFSNGFAEVKINGKWGYIDKKGKIAIPAIYDDVWPFWLDGKAMVAQKGKQWKKGIININGVFVLNCEYDDVNAVNNNLYGYKKSENKSKIFNKDGKILFEIEGSGQLTDRGEKMSLYRNTATRESIILNNINKIILKGNFTTSDLYYKGVLEIVFSGKEAKYIDMTGAYITFEEYLKRSSFFDKGEQHKIWHRFGKSGLINRKGEYVLQPEYEFNELKQVATEIFLITRNNSFLFSPPSTYYTVNGADKLVFSGSKDLVFFEKSGKTGIANQKGEIVVSAIYDEIKGRDVFASDEDQKVFRVRQKDLWGLIDWSGRIIVPVDFEKIDQFCQGETIAYKKGKEYIIKKTGDIKFITDHKIGFICNNSQN
jgi:hypothetical protein